MSEVGDERSWNAFLSARPIHLGFTELTKGICQSEMEGKPMVKFRPTSQNVEFGCAKSDSINESLS